MNPDETRIFLEQKTSQFNTPAFIEGDPVKVPHQFSSRENKEISGMLAALLAWGQREVITRKALDLVYRMEGDPYHFLMNMEESDLGVFAGFRHRTFLEEDAAFVVRGLSRICRDGGGLSTVFRTGYEKDGTVKSAIEYFRETMLQSGHLKRSEKHLASPASGSAAKRLNMYLRWMVRKDTGGVDFGIWDFIPPSELRLPLDRHTGTVARQLGLLRRKQDDWKAVEEVTSVLRGFDPEDPIKYDFALFGTGFYDKI